VRCHPAVLGSSLPISLPDGRVVEHANLDYAATAPCLVAVADAVNEILPWHASVHRGAGAVSRRCTHAYEQARETISDYLDLRADDQLIFTRNTTDSMNLLARCLPAGATVVVWDGEHHATLLPWPSVVRLPAPSAPVDAVSSLALALSRLDGPVLVAVTGASNVTGELWPVDELTQVAHAYGARVAVDAAQLAPHRALSLARSGVDYLALSGHKMYAPFGAGVLAGRGDWLDAATPYLSGGGATAHVGDRIDDVIWQHGAARHEAGSPNLLGAVALAAACQTLDSERESIEAHERSLVAVLRTGLASIEGVLELRLFNTAHDRVGIVSFALAGVAAADVSAYLAAEHGIGVRDGLFCAHPLTRRLLASASYRLGGVPLGGQAVRASVGIGSTEEHVERLLRGLRELATRSAAHEPAADLALTR
jgi:selenocysteine lyase/cysteine desulfurase